jgi:hypothetical protein
VVWCLIKGNKSHGTVIHQKFNHPKYLYPFYWCFTCSIYQILRCHFQQSLLLTHTNSDSLLRSVSYSLNPLLSFSLYLSLAYSPPRFHLSPFYIFKIWFKQPASLNKCISTNVVPLLGFAQNTFMQYSKMHFCSRKQLY